MRLGGGALPGAVCVLALLTAAFTTPSADAHEGTVRPTGMTVDETVTLPADNWTAYEVSLQAQTRLTYDVRVVSGSAIDIYILSSSGLAEYRGAALFFHAYEGFENTIHAQGLFTGASGLVYFLADNVNGTGADATGDVTVRVALAPEATEPISWIVLATCGLGFAAAITVGVLLAVRNRKRRLAPAPAPPLVLPPPPPPPPPP